MSIHTGDEGNACGTINDVIHRWKNLQSVRSIASELNLSRYKVTRIIAAHSQSA